MLKAAWSAAREAAASSAKAAVAAIKPFEDGIRRPYFHVKPLDSAQVVNWSLYLDHIEAKADRTACIKLYERCLVACAGYPGQCHPLPPSSSSRGVAPPWSAVGKQRTLLLLLFTLLRFSQN